MKGYQKTDLGQVIIDSKVIVSYASDVANSTPGIVGMAFVDAKDGIAKLLKREAAFKGIAVSIADNKVTIDYHLIVKFGVNVFLVKTSPQCRSLRKTCLIVLELHLILPKYVFLSTAVKASAIC